MGMEENTKRRRMDSESPPPIKVEVKEENVLGNDYLMAKGRLQGVLRQLTEQSESDTEDSEEENNKSYRSKKSSKRKHDNLTPMRSTYLMKLYDRSVDLAKFEEDTPLYPICRAWMANNSKKPQTVIKRRLSSPEPEPVWNSNVISDVYRLPHPIGTFTSRVPSPTPEQASRNKDNINLNYEEKPPVTKHQLMKEHLERWSNIKRKWISTSAKNEERYMMSKNVLQTIYSKAQESMLGD